MTIGFRRRLAAALLLACAGGLHAQPISLALPAQDLESALLQFADRADLRLVYSAELTRGLRSRAVQGEFSPQQALQQLLEGSGIEFHFNDDGTVMLSRAAAADGAMLLGPVRVRGSAPLRTAADTEGTGAYTSPVISMGKGRQSVRETPQSISVVTRQRLDDQNLHTLGEAMRYTTGMKTTSYGTGTDNIEARGYDLDSYQLDGVPVEAGNGSWSSGFFDLAMFDRVEVWRGPAGVLQGSGEPGGAVNLARKRARDDFALADTLSAGSWDNYRNEFDVTGPLNESGTLRGRFVNVYQDRQYFTDYLWSRTWLNYGTLEYDFTDRTTLSVVVARQEGKSRPFYGLSTYLGELPRLDRSSFVGADWNRKKEHLTFYLTELEHELANGGEAKLTASLLDRDSDSKHNGWSDSLIDPASGNVTMLPIAIRSDEKDINVDGFVDTPVTLFGRSHDLLIGASYRRFKGGSTYNASTYGDFGVEQNIFDPDVHIPEPDLPLGEIPDLRQTQIAVYGRARIKLAEPLTLVLGGRVADWKTEDGDNPAAEQSIHGKFLPYVGLVFDLNDNLSLYASYSSIFKAQTTQEFDGDFLDPREGDQYEVGIKGEYFDQRLTSHFALFRIVDSNRAITDPDHPNFSIASGEVESQGLEAEISGSITPQWELTAGYAYTETEYIEAPLNEKGEPFTTTFPKHNFTLWTKYVFADGWLRGASAAFGLKKVSENSYEEAGFRWKQPGYALAMAQLGYRFSDHVETTLTVNNLFDKYYYDRIGPTRQTYFGEPRSATLALRYRY